MTLTFQFSYGSNSKDTGTGVRLQKRDIKALLTKIDSKLTKL